MSKQRVSVTYTTGDDDRTISCIEGVRSVILMESEDEVDLTVINVEGGWKEVCDVLEEALLQARMQQAYQLLELNN